MVGAGALSKSDIKCISGNVRSLVISRPGDDEISMRLPAHALGRGIAPYKSIGDRRSGFVLPDHKFQAPLSAVAPTVNV